MKDSGNSMVVHWLGLGAFTAVAQVQFLVRELRSHKPRNVAKGKKKKNEGLGEKGRYRWRAGSNVMSQVQSQLCYY